MPFSGDIIERAKRNTFFLEVLATGPHSQVVVMSIVPGEEVHDDVDQVPIFVASEGTAIVNGERQGVGSGRLVHVPGRHPPQLHQHWDTDLRLYAIYAPPEHAPGRINRTRAEAAAAEIGP